MNRVDALRQHQRSMKLFSQNIVGLTLYDYEVEWADYMLDVVSDRRTETVVIEMPRQSGKNETSAQVETAILAKFARRGGQLVKCAPTWKPQIVNSKERFAARAAMVVQRLPFLKFQPSQGYKYKCGLAGISFLSADPNASVVGDTASLLLEVDEAQDINQDKFNKDFAPMRASTGAPLVLYGTTWTDDTLLEQFKRAILEGRTAGRVFRVLPEMVGESNPRYWDFVESEIARLGSRDHPFIRTQYFLEPLATAGRMLKRDHLELLVGSHSRQAQRTNEAQIVAGLDFAGADEAATLVSLGGQSSRDSVALSIGAVEWQVVTTAQPADADKAGQQLLVPRVRILARYEWVNVNPVTLHSALFELLANRWKANRVHCDATGIGATSTAFLAAALNKHGREVVTGRTFDSAWSTHTELAFQYLATVMGGRLQDYQAGDFNPLAVAGAERVDTESVDRHGWWQRGHAKLEGRPNQRVRAYVPSNEGHDDILLAEMLMVDAAYEVGQPRKMVAGSVNFYG
jgi:hypothetical protein